MRVRCYPEGNVGLADSYDITPGALGCALRGFSGPGSHPPTEAKVAEALANIAQEYAEEWDLSTSRPQNVCVEPVDDEARALPGWHPAEEDEEDARPFRCFVVTARVEVAWSTVEVATFNPSVKPAVPAEEVKLEAAPIILTTYEVINPSDAVVLDAPSDAVTVAAVAILGVGRYAAKREGFNGPLFLVGGQDEWFREHGGGLTCEAYLLANIAPIAAALKSARYLGQQTSLAPIVDNAHQLAEAMEAKLATSGEPS